MFSARSRNCAAPWKKFVFWVWLASFVFSGAAKDLFHAPHCPQNLILRWAEHAAHDSPSVSLQTATPLLQLEIECAACVFPGFAALFRVAAPAFFALVMALSFARFGQFLAPARAFARAARGPPLRLNPPVSP